MKNVSQFVLFVGCLALASCENQGNEKWYRPSEEPVFTTLHGNNHDAVLFVDSTSAYPYKLIVSSWGCRFSDVEQTFLWRSKTPEWSSVAWELVDPNIEIGCQYEYDDGLYVNGKYYIFEDGIVYTYEGDLEGSSGKWVAEGTFPKERCDDVGAYYEDGLFHLFGEFGKYPHGPDGTSLSHFTSATGVGDWLLVDTLAVNPNENGENTFGVGDPTIVKMNGVYHLFCDMESKDEPYQIIEWTSTDLNKRFTKTGTTLTARKEGTANWDNYSVQDGEIGFDKEKGHYYMICNFKDIDGQPGGQFPHLKFTRVLGFFYMQAE